MYEGSRSPKIKNIVKRIDAMHLLHELVDINDTDMPHDSGPVAQH